MKLIASITAISLIFGMKTCEKDFGAERQFCLMLAILAFVYLFGWLEL